MQVFLSDMSEGTSISGSEAEIPLVERVLGSVSELADGIEELVDGFRPTMFDAVVQQILATEDQSGAARGADTSTETRQSYFTEPLCDFLLELFQLKHKSDWLRRRAIVVVLQNLLGSTIERCVAICLCQLASPKNEPSVFHRSLARCIASFDANAMARRRSFSSAASPRAFHGRTTYSTEAGVSSHVDASP